MITLDRMHHSASAYSQRGWPVFPCAVGKKIPATGNGFKNATTDDEQIDRWWGSNGQPFNIGISVGAAGLVVIDVDCKNDKDGYAALEALETELGQLPLTLEQTTPSGGKHLFFRCPDGVEIRSGNDKLAEGVDVKSAGGYVLVSPSITEVGQYQWRNKAAVAALPPAWIQKLLQGKQPKQKTTTVTDTHADLLSDLSDALNYINPKPYDDWIKVGGSLWSLGDAGFLLWDTWSRNADNYDANATRKRWNSFAGMNIEPKTVFYMADQSGWKNPRKAQPPPDRPSTPVQASGKGKDTSSVAQPSVGVEDNTGWENQFLRNREGIKNTMRNVALVLNNRPEWAGVFGYCDFSYRIMKRKPPPYPGGCIGEWSNVDTLSLKDWLGKHYAMTPSNNEVDDAVLMVAKDHAFHPVREYLTGLVWDGAPRLDHWLNDTLEAEGESEYLAAVGRKFLIGAVARIMRPPVKMDNVLILEGDQGAGKSTLVRVLFNGWYSESTFDIGAKDGYQHIQGVWGVELPELDSMNKAESTTAKSFFTALTDRFRPPYGRNMEEFARQCVFIGTTNQDEYLKDYSGNRRYWPVFCHKVDLGMLEKSRDQLWAEALQRFTDGEVWWVDGDESELFKRHQDKRMLDDPWESLIADWLDALERRTIEFFTSADIIIGACGRDAGHIQRADQNRIAPILKHLGWISTRKRIEVDGKKGKHLRRVYLRPLKSEAEF